MGVYVDRSRNEYGRMIMCHMIADTPSELHEMADRIGVDRRWFQRPPKASFWHYDIAQSKRALAIAAGAVECDRNAFVVVLRRIRSSRVFVAYCETCDGRGWINEECESAIAGYTIDRNLKPTCDECDGRGHNRVGSKVDVKSAT